VAGVPLGGGVFGGVGTEDLDNLVGGLCVLVLDRTFG
jgi:hypothetical protein